MPRTALAAYVLFLLIAFVLRAVIQVRRTGRTGFVSPSAMVGATERIVAALFTAVLVAAAAAPVLQLAGVVEPLAALDRPLVHAIGLALGGGGIALTLWAQLGMGDSWRVGVDTTERTALVTGGPFAIVRNPIFSAMLLAVAGLALLTPNVVALGAAIALLVAVEIQVRRVEEPYLERTHGDAYRRYAGTVGRFVPGLGRRADFVPALGHRVLTPLYDLAAWIAGATRIKRRLLEKAAITPEADVLDVGCGTGTLALMAASQAPSARIVGLDVDPDILSIARRKVARAGAGVTLAEGSATDPPFAPASFDRVLTTLMLHHLTTPQKRATLAAVRRLLRPGGELHVADFGRPHTALMRLASQTFHLFDGDDATGANLRGELPGLIREAGFADVEETERWSTPFGTVTFLRAAATG
jgi:protein-S-isoprenylcysteine O-methyltransferase Ste14/protein-L-isoaspartate O-methyltransferase